MFRAAVLFMVLAAVGSATAQARVLAERQIELDVGRDRSLIARVQVPASSEPMPAVMLFGGFERGAAALDLVSPDRPTVMASFDYPLELPEQASFSSVLRALRDARRGIRDSIAGIGALHSALQALPEVDPGRITVIGVSLGAPFAVIAAAEHDIPGLAVIHGFGEVPKVIAHQFVRRWEPERGPWVRPFAHGLARVLSLVAGIPDVEGGASRLRANQQVLMLIAADDELVPASASEALLSALHSSAAETESEVESGRHLTGAGDPRIPDLLRRTERWLVGRGL